MFNKSFLNHLFIFLILALVIQLRSQSFQDFINELNNLPEYARPSKVDSFMNVSAIPVTEDSLAHFVYVGTGTNPAIPGDFSGWDPANAPMTHISGTQFWYRTEIFDRSARLDYKLYHSNGTWILDPNNPFTAPGGYGDNSELRMPDYVPPEEIKYFSDIPHGTLTDTTFYSTNLNNSRRIRVYIPPGYSTSTTPYPVVIVNDGLEYLSFAKMNNVLDYLLSEDKIQPLIAVFIPPVDRSNEYVDSKQQAFTSFIVDEIIPWLESRYNISEDAGQRAVIGSSNGGNISLWLGMKHPEIFHFIGAFSSYIEPEIQTTFQNNSRMDLNIYMNIGTYDHIDVIHSSVNAFLPVLQNKGYDYLFQEFPEGHSYGLWRAHIDDALIYFFPAGATGIDETHSAPEGFNLYQNYPNPFNPSTTIPFTLLTPAVVKLLITNIIGQQIRVVDLGYTNAGNREFVWNGIDEKGHNVPSGIYFYRMEVFPGDGRGHSVSSIKKMLLLK